MDLVKPQEQLQLIASQINDIYKEGFVQSRMILVETYHQIGQLILSLPSRYAAVQDLAPLTELSERTLYYAAQFYDKYPVLDKVPEGKNISWNKLITKYLPENNKELSGGVEECSHAWVCTKCGLRK